MIIYELLKRGFSELDQYGSRENFIAYLEGLFSYLLQQSQHEDFDTTGRYVSAHLALAYIPSFDLSTKECFALLTFLRNAVYRWMDLGLPNIYVKGPETYASLAAWKDACLAPSNAPQLIAITSFCNMLDKDVLEERLHGKSKILVGAFLLLNECLAHCKRDALKTP